MCKTCPQLFLNDVNSSYMIASFHNLPRGINLRFVDENISFLNYNFKFFFPQKILKYSGHVQPGFTSTGPNLNPSLGLVGLASSTIERLNPEHPVFRISRGENDGIPFFHSIKERIAPF